MQKLISDEPESIYASKQARADSFLVHTSQIMKKREYPFYVFYAEIYGSLKKFEDL